MHADYLELQTQGLSFQGSESVTKMTVESHHAMGTVCHTGRTSEWIGPPVMPFYPFLGEGSPTKIDYRKKGTLILTFLLEDLDRFP